MLAWNQGVRNYVTISLLVTVASGICTVLVSAWTAYGLTRTRMPAKPLVVGFVLGGLMLSPTVAVIPLVKMMQAPGPLQHLQGIDRPLHRLPDSVQHLPDPGLYA